MRRVNSCQVSMMIDVLALPVSITGSPAGTVTVGCAVPRGFYLATTRSRRHHAPLAIKPKGTSTGGVEFAA